MEAGDDKNVPSFLSQTPWYFKTDQGHSVPSKPKPTQSLINEKKSKTIRVFHSNTKFRPGACSNCGSLSHTTKDCCDRPRKIGAQFTGKIVEYDEIVEKKPLSYDEKHDRWSGYESKAYDEVMDEYKKLEEAKKKRKIEILQEKFYEDEEFDLSDGEKNEEYRFNVLVNNVDPRTKTVTFNNRSRDDPVCYISNIDPEVNNYDGKSRSFKDVPIDLGSADQLYRDSWIKVDKDMAKMIEQEQFIQKLSDRGNDVHSFATPSHAAILFNLHKDDKKSKLSKSQKKLSDKYGDQSYSDT